MRASSIAGIAWLKLVPENRPGNGNRSGRTHKLAVYVQSTEYRARVDRDRMPCVTANMQLLVSVYNYTSHSFCPRNSWLDS